MATAFGLFLLLGGIGMFLYGINFTSKGLEKVSGDKLKSILSKMSKNGILSILAGLIVTVLIQSSGATSVMAVGFVSAGLMNLPQALYTMLGANIGTTVTAQIIAFDVEAFAPLILFVGVVMYQFINNKTVNGVGSIVLGFGILFVGIYIMGEAVDSLNMAVLVQKFISEFDNPILMFLFGLLFTAIIQSSSASVGILQVLAMETAATAGITLSSVAFMIIGMNVGACAPVILAAIGSKGETRRTAFGCFIVKLIGALIFIVIMLILPFVIDFVIDLTPDDVSRQIANFHLLFNLVATILVCPFVKPVTKLLEKIMPDEEKKADLGQMVYVDAETMLAPPAVAVIQAKKEIVRMGNLAYDNLNNAVKSFFERDTDLIPQVLDTEKAINRLNHELLQFLVHLNGRPLPANEMHEAGMMFNVVADIERLSDHAENISEYTQMLIDENITFSYEALRELETMAQNSLHMVNLSLKIYDENNFDKLEEASELEEIVDELQDTLIANHIERLKREKCSPRGGVIFTDLVSDLERCSDHAINVACAIINEEASVKVKRTYSLDIGKEKE